MFLYMTNAIMFIMFSFAITGASGSATFFGRLLFVVIAVFNAVAAAKIHLSGV